MLLWMFIDQENAKNRLNLSIYISIYVSSERERERERAWEREREISLVSLIIGLFNGKVILEEGHS